MKRLSKIFAVFTVLCMILASVPVMAEEIVENMTYEVLVEGDNALAVEDASAVNIYLFEPTEESQVGIYKVTTNSADARLRVYGGSAFFWFDTTESSDYDEATNSFTFEVKNIGPSFLIGVTGASEFTITIEYLGASDGPIDPGTLPYEEYMPLYTPQPFTLDIADNEYLEYVNVTSKLTTPTAVYAADGYYHLNSADGPILYMNLGVTDYFAFPAASELGALRAYVYDTNGEFLTKYDFNNMYSSYYTCSDATYYVYPLNDDLVYMLQTVGYAKGWYDYEKRTQGAYLFGETNVNSESAWMFPLCYVVAGEAPASERNFALNGDVTTVVAGEEVALNAEFYTADGVAYRFSQWVGDVETAGIDATLASQTFIMPDADVTLDALYIAIGDIVEDGMITGKDLNAMKRMVVSLMAPVDCADINGDGQINAGDTNLLMRYMLSLWLPTK